MVAATIQLVNPAWVWGLTAAVALPLLAHLLSTRGGRLAAFPAARFVQQAAADTARLLRPRHRLLLLLRSCALGAIVLGLAQPVWFGAAVASPGAEGLAVVLIVDRTASMTRTEGGTTLFDDARRRAIDLLEGLDPARDVANVVVLDDVPHALLPAASANMAALIGELEAVEPVLTHGDAAAAVALARAELRRMPAQPLRQLRIEVFSDMQATQWRDALRDRAIPIRVHRIGPEQDNVAVFAPVCSVARAVAGQPVAVSLQVGNFTAQQRDVAVTLTRGHEVARQVVRIDAYTTGTTVFDITPPVPGTIMLRFELAHDGDALALDDRTGLNVPVAAARPVTLVTASSIDDPTTAAFFIDRALRAEGGGIELAVQRPGTPLGRDTDVVIIAEVGDVTPDVDPEEAAVIRMADAEESGSFAVSEVRVNSPLLAVFEGEAMRPLLDTRFTRRTRTTVPEERTLIGFADGSPLLTVGDRRATLWADLSPRSTDFVKGPAFAPLLHQLIRGLAPPPPVRESNSNPASHAIASLGRQPDGRWIELAASESDLRTVAPDAEEASSAIAGSEAVAGLRGQSIQLWPALLAAGVLCLIVEPLAAQWHGGRRDD